MHAGVCVHMHAPCMARNQTGACSACGQVLGCWLCRSHPMRRRRARMGPMRRAPPMQRGTHSVRAMVLNTLYANSPWKSWLSRPAGYLSNTGATRDNNVTLRACSQWQRVAACGLSPASSCSRVPQRGPGAGQAAMCGGAHQSPSLTVIRGHAMPLGARGRGAGGGQGVGARLASVCGAVGAQMRGFGRGMRRPEGGLRAGGFTSRSLPAQYGAQHHAPVNTAWGCMGCRGRWGSGFWKGRMARGGAGRAAACEPGSRRPYGWAAHGHGGTQGRQPGRAPARRERATARPLLNTHTWGQIMPLPLWWCTGRGGG